MQFGLTEEQQMIVDTVRSFVEHEIYPHEDAVERSGEVPQEIADEIKRKTLELGFYACNFPEEVGGAGLSHVDFALVERELGRGSMALNHFFGRPQTHCTLYTRAHTDLLFLHLLDLVSQCDCVITAARPTRSSGTGKPAQGVVSCGFLECFLQQVLL